MTKEAIIEPTVKIILVVLLWKGFIDDVASARNVALFYLWLVSICTFAIFPHSPSHDIYVSHLRKGNPNTILKLLFPLAVSLFILWHGAWISCVACILAQLLHLSMVEESKQSTKEVTS